jgi:uncharacterized protein (TIGR00251 family)
VGATLRVRVIPRAKKNDITGWRDEALVVRLTAPPVGGAANKLLKRFLAKRLGIRPSDVEIVRGEKSRDKVLKLEGLSQDQVTSLLG